MELCSNLDDETRVLWCRATCGCVDCSPKASDSLRVKDTAERIVVPEILSASERYILLFWGLLVVLLLLAMAEEKQILLDRKVLSLDLESVREFAIQAKVDKSDLEGKGKLDIIRAIRRKVEDSVSKLQGDDQIESLDG